MSRFPCHLHRPIPEGHQMAQTAEILKKHRLNTVCIEAKCPNRLECYTNRTATFLALGKLCTRSCAFCEIGFSKSPPPPEKDEPDRIAFSVQELGLRHAVITMVTRDDLADQGAGHIAAIIRAIRRENPKTSIEVLTSDFSGNHRLLDIVLEESPDIFNHNLETVRSLTPRIRHKAEYERSLALLRYAKESKKVQAIKSGIMIGLGETEKEVFEAIDDLHSAFCDIITIGQYLQPSRRKLPVKEFISLEQFQTYEQYGLSQGVNQMLSGPFVRSDYNASFFLH
jgi:lipoyl synthase